MKKAAYSPNGFQKAALWHIKVAPLTNLPPSREQFLTYASDRHIEAGTLVSVPIRNRTLSGVVFESREATKKLPFRLRNITAVLQERFLWPEQLSLALFLAETSLTPLGRCLVHFTPTIAKPRVNQLSLIMKETSNKNKLKPISLTADQQKALRTLLHNQSKPRYLFGPASSGKTELYIRTLKKKLSKGKQGLVLVPELSLLPQETDRYGAAFGFENIAVLHGQLSPGEFYRIWGKIARKEVSLILGTRQALFAPFRNLACIVVDEEQDNAYKQRDMSPRYDGRRVAEKLAEIHKASLIFGSATPSVERLHRAQSGAYRLVKIPRLPMQPGFSIETINLRFEKKRKNPNAVSEPLLQAIDESLKQNRQVLLFVHRQGTGAFSVCNSCKSVLRCNHCDRALSYDAAKNTYRCTNCSTSSSFPQCSECRGLAFTVIGIGTQKVEREIRKRFPLTAIERIDRQSTQKKGERERIFRDFENKKTKILIGTQMAIQGWDLPNIALVGIIDADSLFAWPDFSTDENAFGHIVQATGRMARIGAKSGGRALIQTFYPENPTLQKICSGDADGFYKEAIEQRKSLFYPPFSRLIRILVQQKDLPSAQKMADRVHARCAALAKEFPEYARVSPVQAPIVSFAHGKKRLQFILRCQPGNIPAKWNDLLRSIVTKDCSVDIDPIGIA